MCMLGEGGDGEGNGQEHWISRQELFQERAGEIIEQNFNSFIVFLRITLYSISLS